MSTKKLFKMFLAMVVLILLSTVQTFATTAEVINSVNSTDTVAPVFDPSVQTRYVLKRADDGSQFIPESLISNIKATDNVDGNNVTIGVAYNGVNLSQDGQYQVLYTATDRSGNTSCLVVTVIVDGVAPTFNQNTENLYYIKQSGAILDSNNNIVESLPKTLTATDALGAYTGIGVYITLDGNGNILVVDTVEDTPAANILQVNDIIIGLDGEDLTGKTPDYVANTIKSGENGTNVELKILRNQEEMTVTIERQTIKLYGDQELEAEPNIVIDSIDKDQNGAIDITYTATDEAGNSAEFVVKLIIVDTEDVEDDNVTPTDTTSEDVDLEDETIDTDIIKDNNDDILASDETNDIAVDDLKDDTIE